MTNEDRIKLLEAGYTKEEIEAGEQKPAAEEAEAGNEESSKQSAEDQEHESAINLDLAALSSTVKELAETVKNLQSENIKKATGNTPKDEIGDVMKSFIESM